MSGLVNCCEFCGKEECEGIVTLYATTQGIFCKSCLKLLIDEFTDVLKTPEVEKKYCVTFTKFHSYYVTARTPEEAEDLALMEHDQDESAWKEPIDEIQVEVVNLI